MADMMAESQEAAARYREKRKAAGLKVTKSPFERLAEKPSARRAIAAECYDCQGQDAERGWRWKIGNCECPDCPLYAFRPYPAWAGRPVPVGLA